MGLDSVEFVMAVEEAFQIAIPDGEAERMLTPRQVVDYILGRLGAAERRVCLEQRAFYRLRRAVTSPLASLPSPIATASWAFVDDGAYGEATYAKTALALKTLENLVGRDAFLAAMTGAIVLGGHRRQALVHDLPHREQHAPALLGLAVARHERAGPLAVPPTVAVEKDVMVPARDGAGGVAAPHGVARCGGAAAVVTLALAGATAVSYAHPLGHTTEGHQVVRGPAIKPGFFSLVEGAGSARIVRPLPTASVLAALDIIEQEPQRIENLWKNTRKMKAGFDALGFDTGRSVTPIIPILVGDDMKTFTFWKMLFDNGIFANPVITPAVPPGQGRIRTSYMATHTDEQLNRALEIYERVGRQMNLI